MRVETIFCFKFISANVALEKKFFGAEGSLKSLPPLPFVFFLLGVFSHDEGACDLFDGVP